jgi:hypothetical protein
MYGVTEEEDQDSWRVGERCSEERFTHTLGFGCLTCSGCLAHKLCRVFFWRAGGQQAGAAKRPFPVWPSRQPA